MSSIILILFLTFLQIGSFSIGGGYAIIPLIQQQVVNYHNWLSIQEYTDIITISQMTPGPLVVNTATFVGVRIAGILGAIAATLGSTLAGFIVSIILYNFFKKHQDANGVTNILRGLRSSSVGLIASAASTIVLLALFGTSSLEFSLGSLNVVGLIVFITSLLVLRRYKPNPIMVIIVSGVIGLIFN